VYKLRLAKLRKERNLSQAELAQNFKIAQNTLSQWETGKRDIDLEAMISMAKYFNVSTDYFLGLTNDRHNIKSTGFNQDETSLIKKYRTLDEYGKERILSALALESKQIINKSKPVKNSL